MSRPGDLKSEIVVEITDLSRSGTGVARGEDGRVVFVPFTAPGDLVRAKITKSDKRFSEADLLEVLRPSAIRQKPPCPVFGRCGGCQWQHIPYEMQWATKVKGALQALARVQVTAPSQIEELPADQIWNYRNRVQLRGFKSELGFYVARSHERVAVDSCAIARPELNAIFAETREAGQKFESPYKVELEILPDGTIRTHWNSAHGAGGFRQVHDEQNVKLRTWVAGAVTPGLHIYDLFGGSGNLGKTVAARALAVDCVDVGAPEGTQIEGLPELRFHRSPVAKWIVAAARIKNEARLQAPLEKTSRPEKAAKASAILDPPREGLGDDHDKIISALETLNVQEIVAVGCESDAWARDVSRLIKRGWKFERVAFLDLFPQTPHVECLALFKV
jgi:23S rRNA (uracil1939-C5)-methyltransferase